MRLPGHGVLAAGALAAAACEAPEGGTTTTTGEILGRPALAFEAREVDVCWENPAGPALACPTSDAISSANRVG